MERTTRTADLGKWLMVTTNDDYDGFRALTDEVLWELRQRIMEGGKKLKE